MRTAVSSMSEVRALTKHLLVSAVAIPTVLFRILDCYAVGTATAQTTKKCLSKGGSDCICPDVMGLVTRFVCCRSQQSGQVVVSQRYL